MREAHKGKKYSLSMCANFFFSFITFTFYKTIAIILNMYSTAEYSTVLYSTLQYSTVQLLARKPMYLMSAVHSIFFKPWKKYFNY